MKTNTLYFQHDYNARNDQRLLELRAEFGAEGYGIFWMIIETMFESDGILNRGAIGGLSLGYCIPKGDLMAIITFCIDLGLFFEDEENTNLIFNERVNKQLEFRKQLSIKGLEGAKKRWGDKKNGGANGGANAKVKESKVKKRKDISFEFEKFWNMYGKKIGRPKCENIFKRLSKVKVEKIFETLPEYLIATPDVQFRKHPSTYLNQESWNDEIPEFKTPCQVKEEQEEAELQRKYKLGLI